MGTARSRTPPLAVMEKGSIETGLHSDSDRQKTCSYRFSAGFVILKQQCHHVPHRSFEGCFNRPGGACIEILQLVQLAGTGKGFNEGFREPGGHEYIVGSLSNGRLTKLRSCDI